MISKSSAPTKKKLVSWSKLEDDGLIDHHEWCTKLEVRHNTLQLILWL